MDQVDNNALSAAQKLNSIFKEAFSIFDKRGNGTIETSDLKGLLHCLGEYPKYAELQMLINEVDPKGKGFIRFPDLVTIMGRKLRLGSHNEKDILEAFCIFASDVDDYITPAKFKRAMEKAGKRISDEEIGEMIAAADKNGDGQIDFDEFKAIINGS
ncbi:neo-calmodulin-like [Teleopsis dalmanni]|uniref:neo-calmodulin-like n=1 Tax=Teleopsis dalmanni TaxID=139649 RepID=UPI0018CE2483|nr:neo-calmodulin-like [Teleopsis dalmanni]